MPVQFFFNNQDMWREILGIVICVITFCIVLGVWTIGDLETKYERVESLYFTFIFNLIFWQSFLMFLHWVRAVKSIK